MLHYEVYPSMDVTTTLISMHIHLHTFMTWPVFPHGFSMHVPQHNLIDPKTTVGLVL